MQQRIYCDGETDHRAMVDVVAVRLADARPRLAEAMMMPERSGAARSLIVTIVDC